MEYASRMASTGISLTLKGGCFSQEGRQDLTDEMISSHKFYFSFENGFHCRYYITEKFWDMAFGHDTVPVVWGAPLNDVISVAPPNSFIHSDNFESPETLARYLDFLDRNDDEYRKYFAWSNRDHII